VKDIFMLFTGKMVLAIFENRKTKTRRVADAGKLYAITQGEVRGDWPFSETRASGKCKAVIHDRGAVAVLASNGKMLGVKPGEFDFVCPYSHGKTVLVDGAWRIVTVPDDRPRVIVKEAAWMFCERRPNGTTKTGRPKWLYVPLRYAPVHYCAHHPEKPQLDVVHQDTGNKWMWKYKPARFLPKWASRLSLEVVRVHLERLQDISEKDALEEGADIGFDETTVNFQPGALNPITASYRAGFRCLWNSINAARGFGWDLNPWVWAVEFRRVKL